MATKPYRLVLNDGSVLTEDDFVGDAPAPDSNRASYSQETLDDLDAFTQGLLKESQEVAALENLVDTIEKTAKQKK